MRRAHLLVFQAWSTHGLKPEAKPGVEMPLHPTIQLVESPQGGMETHRHAEECHSPPIRGHRNYERRTTGDQTQPERPPGTE